MAGYGPSASIFSLDGHAQTPELVAYHHALPSLQLHGKHMYIHCSSDQCVCGSASCIVLYIANVLLFQVELESYYVYMHVDRFKTSYLTLFIQYYYMHCS